ncbi:alpha/beta-hydrolase family protein [Acuticoccus sp. M5D2P5]|uniref:alpha/beta hydrolase n=1 Tax=Acuticoccus kalidii TaxID=2910977 RepID=UPI001F3F4720|nr:alpha/beta-hydrolase family protein [Acuticoccus kalidii]MCF3932656.1 alpha/beta-hydrolase family protein [Acuticoccus kalidii]
MRVESETGHDPRATRLVSGTGLSIGFLLFAASLTPSLIPRDALMQGLLGGALFAFGYLVGIAAIALWDWLGLRRVSRRAGNIAAFIAAAFGLSCLAFSLSKAAEWQDSIRVLMGLPPVDTTHPLSVALIAAGMAAVLFFAGWVFKLIVRQVGRRLERVIPERVAITIAIGIAAFLFFSLIDGVLIHYSLRAVDSFYAKLDSLIDPDTEAPTDPMTSGSEASLVNWRELGAAGRQFVANTTSEADLAAFWGGPVTQPRRVYVGLGSADDVEERAELALDELIRVGGFEREVLIVAIPTGTGFMDQGAIAPLEYLHRGDTATVAMQYSYLQSPFSLIFEPGYGAATARALMAAIYDHWRAMDRETRPRLYLYGLSLGALSSEESVRFYEILGDPYDGALWAGPPFPSPMHTSVTNERNAESPAWLPRFESGSFVRFTNQTDQLDWPGARWGPMRVVYLQYASDPIVFFDWSTLWWKPDWLNEPRGPDVSPLVRWFPVVTALQLAADMAVSTKVPRGHGHEYAPSNYIDAWVAVTEPDAGEADIARIKDRFDGPQ